VFPIIGLVMNAVYWLCMANKWKLGWYANILADLTIGLSNFIMTLYLNACLNWIFVPFDIFGIVYWVKLDKMQVTTFKNKWFLPVMGVCALLCGCVFGFLEFKYLNNDLGKPWYLTFCEGVLLFVGIFAIICVTFKNKYSLAIAATYQALTICMGITALTWMISHSDNNTDIFVNIFQLENYTISISVTTWGLIEWLKIQNVKRI